MFKAIGEMATEETGYPCGNIFDEFLQDSLNFSSGAYDDWLYQHLGIPAYTVELWDLASRAGITGLWPRKPKTEKEQSTDFAKLLKWNDEELNGEGFVPWRPFEHPQLGMVEIGGWKSKFVVQNCPPQLLLQECEKTARFCYRQAKTMPKVDILDLAVKRVDEQTWKIETLVVNTGYLPTFLTQVALDQKTAKPVTATLELPNGSDVVHGRNKLEIGHLEGRAGRSSAFWMGYFRTGKELPSERRVEWIVKAPAGTQVTLTVRSEKGGSVNRLVVLE